MKHTTETTKKGFTIAEVIMTLVIIGIVAAITIPHIVSSHEKTVLEIRFAKAYQTLSQVAELARMEYGNMAKWGWKTQMTLEEQEAFVEKYFIKYLNVARRCRATNSNKNCFPNVMYKYFDKKNAYRYNNLTRPQLLLMNNVSIDFYFVPGCIADKRRCLVMTVDTNGFEKPNVVGRDLFEFTYYPQTGEFLPQGVNIENSYSETTKSFNKYDSANIYSACTGSGMGWSCGARILQDSLKMKY